MERPRILLADNHKILTEAIKTLLEPEFEVIGTVSDGVSLVDKARELKPDVIITDISLAELNGLEAGRIIKSELPGVKLIYLTMNHDPHFMAEAFQIGASDFLIKQCAYSDLRSAIRQSVLDNSCRGSVTKNQFTTPEFKQSLNRATPVQLTPRQREVLRLLAEGRSMKQVAFALELSTRTVAFHKYRMMDGLKLRSNAELIRFAVRNLVV